MQSIPLVRPARPADRGAIARITLAAYGEYATQMEPSAWHALDQAVRASLVNDTGVTRLVAELDGEIVGSAALYVPGSAAYGDLAGRRQPDLGGVGWYITSLTERPRQTCRGRSCVRED